MKFAIPPSPKNQTECICQLVGMMRAILKENYSFAHDCEEIYRIGPTLSEPSFFEDYCELLEKAHQMIPPNGLSFTPAPPLDHWEQEGSITT